MFFMRTLTRIAKVIQERAEDELYNPAKIQEALIRLQMQLELEQISEEDYDRQEAELLERLSEAQKRK